MPCLQVATGVLFCNAYPQPSHPDLQGSYTERDAATIIRTVLEIVAYAHDMGCVHRDIKVRL